MNSPFWGPANVMMTNEKINQQYVFPADIRQVYFIGIGGIGMSALAKFLFEKGVQVSGYDKTPSPVTHQLEALGIAVHYEEDITQLPAAPDYVVFTPAIPAAHAELVLAREKGLRVVKRSDILQLLTQSSFTIGVAGTHGKTTITTMIAHILRETGFGCNAFLGGISVNYNTNNWSSERNCCVVEADEYDRSFLKLSPSVAVITAMDPDHLDIYGTAAAMEDAFVQFSQRVEEGGMLIKHFGLKRGKELKATETKSYSLQNESADFYAANVVLKDGTYGFDLMMKDSMIGGLHLSVGGMHNLENAVAAIAVASSLDIDHEKIREAVSSFRGVKRRFEYVLKTPQLTFIDDYAHHPEELRALISSAKALFPERACTVIFQPHLFSRTRDLADAFAETLDLADEVILLPIYPARELPIEGVSSELIRKKMKKDQVSVKTKEELMLWLDTEYKKRLNTEFGRLLITAGAGDIDALVEPIAGLFKI